MKLRRVDFELTYIKACPYCRDREIIRATCGSPECQYKHHISSMRGKRKTRQTRPSRRLAF